MEIKAVNATIKAVEHVNAASTSQTVPIFEIPIGAHTMAFGARVKTAFAGVTYPTVKCGVSWLTELYMRTQPIDHAGDLKSGFALNAVGFCEALTDHKKTETQRSIVATFQSSSGSLSSLTAGEIEFFYVYAD